MNLIISKIEKISHLETIGESDKIEIKKISKEIESLEKDWNEKQNKLSYFIEHDELEKVTKCLVVLKENYKNEEYSNSLEDSKEFIYWLNILKKKIL